MKSILPCTLLVFVTANLATASPPPHVPDPKVSEKAVTVAPDVSRWSIGAGIVFRDIEGDFTLKSTGPPPGVRLGGRGDVGLQSGDGRVIRYDDGSVGPAFGKNGRFDRGLPPDGTAYTVTTSGSQFTNTGRTTFFGDPIYNVAFHSNLGIYESNTSHSSDEELGVGPYLELRYAVFRGPKADVNIVLGYSWVSADLDSGTSTLATYTRYDYTYNYDYAFLPSTFGGLLPGSPGLNLNGPFPFFDWSYAIINPGGGFAGGQGYRSPHKTSAIAQQSVLRGQASLDIDLHEIVLAPELQFDLWRRTQVGISVGPTLNFIDSDIDATAGWYRRSGGKAFKTYRFNDSDTDVKLGVAAQLTLTIDLTKRLYFQASGSYRYVPDVHVEAGFASAAIDTSSWQGAVGFGVRL